MPQPARILIVDDDPDLDLCQALSDRLTAQGFHVLVAGSGPDALRLLREETPAIVLLDLVLLKPFDPGELLRLMARAFDRD